MQPWPPSILSLAGGARQGASAIENNNQQSISLTPSRSSRLPPTPLQLRDGNAMMRTPQKGPPLATRSGNAMMAPQEKQTGPSRPIVPTLSTTSTKAVSKAPLTPRIAASAPSSASSPLARRNARQDGDSTPALSQRDAFTTPLSSFLSTNVTPRSGSRKTRVDSASSTPTHTPTTSSTPDILRTANNGPSHGVGGLNINGLQSDAAKRSAVSFSLAFSEVGSQLDQPPSGSDTKFFFASDARAVAQQPKQQPAAQDNKVSTFFYANGDKIPPVISRSSVTGSEVSSTVGEERTRPKFFHVNGTPDLLSQNTSTTSSIVSSSQFSAPKLSTRSTLSPLQRPPSPLKTHQTVSFAQSKHTIPVPSPAPTRSHASQDAPTCKSRGSDSARRGSGHERAASTGALDIGPSTGRVSHPTPIALPCALSPANAIKSSLMSKPEEMSSDLDNDVESLHSDIQSPLRTGHSLERLNELAANARRERKVLDLEITNSSLAAINRTLEREMRKQTAELRRYRRLSRSGRLSINTSISLRTSSVNLSPVPNVDDTQLSDMSEESSDEESEEESEEESIDDGSLSPGAIAESDARHRERDEKRLQLDLSKHQQLLIDSQNMNQSLKRCLGWTEELINEGKKALAYSVRVSDIELGGRVLAPDEVEDTDDESLSGSRLGVLNNIPVEPTTYNYQEANGESQTVGQADMDTITRRISPTEVLSDSPSFDKLTKIMCDGSGNVREIL